MSNRATSVATLLTRLLATLLLGIAVPAGATLRTIEQAYQRSRSQVQLPGKPAGTLTVLNTSLESFGTDSFLF